jgi:hypothetical protein
VLTARTEITDPMLIFGERHLRTILAQYERHYNGRRPHRGRQLRPPRPDHPLADLSQERIKRRPVLGGLIQRVRAGRIEAQVRNDGRVLEPHRHLRTVWTSTPPITTGIARTGAGTCGRQTATTSPWPRPVTLRRRGPHDHQRPAVKSQVKRYDEVMEPYRHSSGGLSNSVPGSCWHAYADLKLPGAGKEEPGKPTGLA